MPFKTFINWLFDGNSNTPVPDELVKPSSPISQLYCISLFMKCGKLNWYLNKYFNNYNVFQIPKEEFFKFIKKCIRDYKISRKDIWYFSKKQKQDKLFDILSSRNPDLKKHEILLLCDIINNSKEKDEVLQGLGIKADSKKEKTKKKKNNDKKNQKNKNVDSFISENFVYVELENKNL